MQHMHYIVFLINDVASHLWQAHLTIFSAPWTSCLELLQLDGTALCLQAIAHKMCNNNQILLMPNY